MFDEHRRWDTPCPHRHREIFTSPAVLLFNHLLRMLARAARSGSSMTAAHEADHAVPSPYAQPPHTRAWRTIASRLKNGSPARSTSAWFKLVHMTRARRKRGRTSRRPARGGLVRSRLAGRPKLLPFVDGRDKKLRRRCN